MLQPGFVDEVSKAVDPKGDPSVVIRYAFFKCKGSFDGEGLVDLTPSQTPVGNQLNEFVGDYVGEQIAGFNAMQTPVPEPASAATLMAGLAVGLVLGVRRRQNALSSDR